ncbi:hypothetical protein [Tissierella sp. Yu-01]|uniref:hypothetical protein n=1 Tax=Tissierella sp. Yu-01 TaxID=3035694 RepID=UPI00240D2E0F|nr:hypothetical protein [Tissierella sp. Yu-01]WFA09918.1 hypothetical protein P3962_05045 [Tissierella sp. Yu-01]
MGKPQNIYWVTETEDYRNYISMQAPGRCFLPTRRKCCFPNPGVGRSFIIDNSNSIVVDQNNDTGIRDNRVENSNVGDITGGAASNSATIDATQVSVLVVVPIIDSFDQDIIPLNGPLGQYRVAAGGRNLDIQVNGDGTYVNGEMLNESQLEDGTRVYIYRNDTVGTNQNN